MELFIAIIIILVIVLLLRNNNIEHLSTRHNEDLYVIPPGRLPLIWDSLRGNIYI